MKPRPYGPFPYSPIIRRPKLTWPSGARVALWIIPNVEFFSLQERPAGYGAAAKIPDVVMWSERDYGNRVGIWRLMEVLDRYRIRPPSRSIACCATTIQSSSRRATSVSGNGWATTKAIPAA